jgi:hypothetical protein
LHALANGVKHWVGRPGGMRPGGILGKRQISETPQTAREHNGDDPGPVLHDLTRWRKWKSRMDVCNKNAPLAGRA